MYTQAIMFYISGLLCLDYSVNIKSSKIRYNPTEVRLTAKKKTFKSAHIFVENVM